MKEVPSGPGMGETGSRTASAPGGVACAQNLYTHHAGWYGSVSEDVQPGRKSTLRPSGLS